jgi:hypothetical protein
LKDKLELNGYFIKSVESPLTSPSARCEIATGLGPEVILILLATILFFLAELGKLLITPALYLRSWLNGGTWALLMLVFSTTVPTLWGQSSISPIQYQAAAVSI